MNKFGTGVGTAGSQILMACQQPLYACEWPTVPFSGGMGDEMSKMKLHLVYATHCSVMDSHIPRFQCMTQCG